MTTLAKTSAHLPTPELFLSYQKESPASTRPWGISEPSMVNKDVFHWGHLTTVNPLVRMLQPDYFMVFRFSSPNTPVYQQNLHLDLGPVEVKYETLLQSMISSDHHHVQRIDRVINQFLMECRLEPFDFICSIICRWDGQDSSVRYFMRKTSVLQCDARGLPCYGIMAFQDVTALVSAIKPYNVDVTFMPEKANLCYELSKRIKEAHPKSILITVREKEIIRCLYRGMSSKEIAGALYISKATVDTHRQNLIRKWEVPNTAAILKRAMEEGIV